MYSLVQYLYDLYELRHKKYVSKDGKMQADRSLFYSLPVYEMVRSLIFLNSLAAFTYLEARIICRFSSSADLLKSDMVGNPEDRCFSK